MVTSLEEVDPTPSVVTIGNFDGVHRGHRSLLHRTVDAALDRDVRAVVITFDPHPAAVLRPGSEPPTLCTLDQRIERLLDAGMDLVVVLPFTRELSELSPEAFVERVLVDRLQASRVVVGTNFRFGHQARGDVVSLLTAGEKHGFDVEAVALRDVDGEPLSSSAVRAALHDGEVRWVTGALGRPYSLGGEVVAGDGRGRTIGIPTANVDVAEGRVVPANGVYAGHATLGEQRWRCVTNIGIRPTFGIGDLPAVEVHLIDVEEPLDLYGEHLEVTFEHRLRSEQRFAGVDELVTQIRADIDAARLQLITSDDDRA
jgi:riboflavin kinase/FMN adenylyltransferase